ncbi:hypothetical protein EJD97_021808 [Solanum chilense]|uniref:Uncharacterized protein n=1 Tax=Solanum chilense TaxID=4083 RepID=A0A6N2C705_SOLCI|nr:hypothetical protein EJD97_021808 [Solanum chilense]
MLHASKTTAVSAFSGVSDYVGKHIQIIAPITALSRGASLRAQDSGVDCQFSSDFLAVHWPYLRHGGSEGNISPSVEQANYFSEASNSFMSCLCNCAVQPDVFVEKHPFIGEPLDTTQVTGAVSLTFKEQITGFLNMDKMRGQSADAGINKPSCDVAFQNVADAGVNKPSCDVAFQNIEYLKEPEISNVSSGGSAPVVSEASAVIHDNEFTTDDQKTGK